MSWQEKYFPLKLGLIFSFGLILILFLGMLITDTCTNGHETESNCSFKQITVSTIFLTAGFIIPVFLIGMLVGWIYKKLKKK